MRRPRRGSGTKKLGQARHKTLDTNCNEPGEPREESRRGRDGQREDEEQSKNRARTDRGRQFCYQFVIDVQVQGLLGVYSSTHKQNSATATRDTKPTWNNQSEIQGRSRLATMGRDRLLATSRKNHPGIWLQFLSRVSEPITTNQAMYRALLTLSPAAPPP